MPNQGLVYTQVRCVIKLMIASPPERLDPLLPNSYAPVLRALITRPLAVPTEAVVRRVSEGEESTDIPA